MWVAYRAALSNLLTGESKAYGFALVIWGSGSIAEAERGAPGVTGVVSFAGGAFAAILVVAALALGSPRSRLRTSEPPRYAFGVLHLVSVAAALFLGWLVSSQLDGKAVSFFSTGGCAVLIYEVLAAAEIALSTDRSPKD